TALSAPSRSRSRGASGLRYSPQIFGRGKRARSTSLTARPCSARKMAVAAPAGPAPTTMTSVVTRTPPACDPAPDTRGSSAPARRARGAPGGRGGGGGGGGRAGARRGGGAGGARPKPPGAGKNPRGRGVVPDEGDRGGRRHPAGARHCLLGLEVMKRQAAGDD